MILFRGSADFYIHFSLNPIFIDKTHFVLTLCTFIHCIYNYTCAYNLCATTKANQIHAEPTGGTCIVARL